MHGSYYSSNKKIRIALQIGSAINSNARHSIAACARAITYATIKSANKKLHIVDQSGTNFSTLGISF